MFKQFFTRKPYEESMPVPLARLDFVPYTEQQLSTVLGGGEELRPDILLPHQDQPDKGQNGAILG